MLRTSLRINGGAVQARALDEFLSSNAQDFIEEFGVYHPPS